MWSRIQLFCLRSRSRDILRFAKSRLRLYHFVAFCERGIGPRPELRQSAQRLGRFEPPPLGFPPYVPIIARPVAAAGRRYAIDVPRPPTIWRTIARLRRSSTAQPLRSYLLRVGDFLAQCPMLAGSRRPRHVRLSALGAGFRAIERYRLLLPRRRSR